METIIEYLKRSLKDATPRRWPGIVAAINEGLPEPEHIGEPLLRKIAYGDRDNPGVKTVQPVLDYFQSIARGDRELPWDGIDRRTAGERAADDKAASIVRAPTEKVS